MISLRTSLSSLSVAFILLQACVITLAAPNSVGVADSTDPRIINGTFATLENTKYLVSIRRRLNDGYFFGTGHLCGGSLLADDLIMTAAHCFVDQFDSEGTFLKADDFIVVMGNLDRFERNNNTFISDIRKISYMIGTFNTSTYEHDVALLFLSQKVPADHPTIKPIVINRKPMDAGTVCNVHGWGITEEGYLSDKLMTVDVPIVKFDDCANNSGFSKGLIKRGMMCAGYMDQGERDACGGDSGGPLACKNLLTGIVSWGTGCAQPMLPGVYTDVAYYSPWIDEQAKAENIVLPRSSAAIFNISIILMGILYAANIFFNTFF